MKSEEEVQKMYYEPIVYRIESQDEGMLLKTILNRRMGISRKLTSRIKLTEHGVKLNGERVYVDYKVRAGDIVEVRMERESSDDILPQPLDFDIIYEDEHLLIINKKAGIIVHPTHGHYTDTLANGVVYYWQQKGEQFRFRPVHRLDQDTSGVLAVAKNPYVHQHISEQMIQDQVFKSYLAYVHHLPQPASGRIEGAIDRDPDQPHLRIVTPNGYYAATRYKVVEEFTGQDAALVSLQLETGRTHQIRVHMKHIGCPLIGDKMYGYADPVSASLSEFEEVAEFKSGDTADQKTHHLPVTGVLRSDQISQIKEPDAPSEAIHRLDELAGRQALHAYELGFVHPATGEYMTFQAPLPEDLALLDASLRGDQQ
ncbi:RluA family pseudouridine synthase [Paenibacillus dauci]|uniref:RluA family pseudouridine synthase n=1 Tax=Paenibacillus dauci TaxID=1567106 RepID=UPI000619976B|nr:RluA family pseudouridine synthase [Paenibacillus dauci]